MANTFITMQAVARRALATLYNNAVFAGLVFRDYDADFDGKVGDTVTVRTPAVFTADEFDRGAGINVQEATEGSIQVSLDTILDVSFAVTAEQLALEIEDFTAQLLNPAMEAIVQAIDAKLAGVLTGVGVTQSVSGDGPTAIVDAGTVLNEAKVPLTERYAVWSPSASGVLLKDPLFHQADQRGDTQGLQEASIGRKFGFDNFMDQVLTEDGVAFHRTAAALVSRTLPIPKGKQGDTAAVASYKGFGLRVVYDYDIDKKQDVISVDFLCGVKLIDGDRACQVDLEGSGS